MQIVLFLVFILVIILIFAAKKDDLSTKTKSTLVVSMLIVILLATFYEFFKNSNAEDSREKLNAFLQGKMLTCKGIKVSKENFEYVSGTQTFVPAKNNIASKGMILEISQCSIQN